MSFFSRDCLLVSTDFGPGSMTYAGPKIFFFTSCFHFEYYAMVLFPYCIPHRIPYCSLTYSFARDSPTFLHSYSYCLKPGYPRSVRLWHRGAPLAASPIIFQGEISDHVAWIGANSTRSSKKCHFPSFCHPRLSWVQVVQRCINFHATERGECKL